MELYYCDKRRLDLLDDHSYTLSDYTGGCPYKGDSILTEAISSFSNATTTVDSTTEWISVDEEINLENVSTTLSKVPEQEEATEFFSQRVHADLAYKNYDSRSHWMQPLVIFRRKILRMLEKCHLQESVDKTRFADLSDFACFKRRQTNRILRTRRVSRTLRNIFAALSWQTESCFAFHHWCVVNLPERFSQLYCEAYTELWNQNKVTPLLALLNKLARERGVPHHVLPETPPHRQPHLYDNPYRTQGKQLLPYALASGHDPRPGHSFTYNNSQRPSGDEIVLACFTFPVSPTSNRLNRLLNELSEIGRVSVETPEEQACDVMRLRFRLYIRRVFSLLEEPKHGPIYLVGFGVSSILVLLSAMHLQSVDLRDERYGIAGLICLGIPLIGLKGPRGYPNDPLLSIPDIPTLFIVGSASRLGGQKQALYFRRLILNTRLKSQFGSTPDNTDASRDSFTEDNTGPNSSSASTGSAHSKTSGVSVLTVGGADYLLRLRPSLCEQCCITQEAIDKRIVSAIKRFILANEHTSQFHNFSESTSIDSSPDTPNHYDMCRLHAMQSVRSTPSLYTRGRVGGGFGPCLSPTHYADFYDAQLQQRRRPHSLVRRTHTVLQTNTEHFL